MKQNFENSKATRNYFVDIVSFFPFLLLLMTGIIMLMYHTGRSYSIEIIGLNGYKWLTIHKTLTIIAVPIVTLHLISNYDWLKKLFTLKLKNKHKGKNISLFMFFLLCVFTSLFSWLVFPDSKIDNALKGIHNKFGLVLIIFYVLHIINYIKLIIDLMKQIFKKVIE